MYITVIPAIRTIPGVEAFDYLVDDGADVRVGDVLRVPFRSRSIPALVSRLSAHSDVADRVKKIEDPAILLRTSAALPALVERTAERTFTSRPSVVSAWIRTVPKRAAPVPTDPANPPKQTGMPERSTRFLVRRWHDPRGLLPTVRETTGRVLILTPWQHRADALAQELGCPVLHADISDGAAWKAIRAFCDAPDGILAATRIGTWLSAVADTVLIDEPENDDLKQDELSPRFDARWAVAAAAEIRPELSVISFSTTPRFDGPETEWPDAPEIEIDLATELRQGRGASGVQGLSARAFASIQEAIDARTPVAIIHPISGERARVVCKDCGWRATCAFCGHELSSIGDAGLCRKCGRKQELPHACPSCGGTDFTRSAIGRDRLAQDCHAAFHSDLVRILSLADLRQTTLPRGGLVIVTDLSLIGGAIEDIRRRERLIVAWRRLAAVFSASNSRVLIQGSEELLTACRGWLTSKGLTDAWKAEYAERKLFSYPPAVRMTKLLLDGSEIDAQSLADDIGKAIPDPWKINGPFPVLFRSKTRTPRWVIHLITPSGTPDPDLEAQLNPFRSRAIIDLDPIAFFS